MTENFFNRLADFRYARLGFTAFLLEPAKLPGSKGSLWHGAFGQALLACAPPVFDALYGESRDKPTRPYVLLPPLTTEEQFPAGAPLDFELTLFGSAVQYADACAGALRWLGQQGIGPQRARFTLAQTTQSDADDLARACAPQEESGTNTVRLRFATPMRLKSRNNVLREAPPLTVVMERLLARLHLLYTLDHETPLLPFNQRDELLASAGSCDLLSNRTNWQDWERFSARKQQSMPFGGLSGEAAYQGEVAPLVPWLRLAEVVHLGSKTTFGMGKIIVLPTPHR